MTIAEEIQAAVVAHRVHEASKGGGKRAAANHASQLGHPCIRKLYYDRTAAELRPAPDERAAFTWEAGRTLEWESERELGDVGYRVEAAQVPFDWRKYNIVGRIDGIVSAEGKTYPIEIKSVSGNDWPGLTSVQAMLESSHWWHRLYPAQLNLYMLMGNYDQGIFYLKCKQTHRPRALLMDLDYDLGERCVKAAEAINEHVEAEIPPDRMEFDAKVCGMCSYRQVICAPPQPLPLRMDEPELIAMLERREQLLEGEGELREVRENMKGVFNEVGIVEVGPFEVVVSQGKKRLNRTVKRLMEASADNALLSERGSDGEEEGPKDTVVLCWGSVRIA